MDYYKELQDLQSKVGIGIGSYVNSSGEETMLNILGSILNKPYCVFDVGTNKGEFLDLVIRILNNDIDSIHCFEPSEFTFKLLCNALTCNDSRIKLNNFGLGEKVEKSVLYYDVDGSGLASRCKRKLDHFNIYFNKKEDIYIDTVDNYCINNNINKINLLKIDVEGYELDVLNGATQMFLNNSIDAVSFEFGGCNIDTRTFFRDFWYFFKEFEFALYRVSQGMPALYYIDKYREFDEQFRTTNYLAVREGLNDNTKTF